MLPTVFIGHGAGPFPILGVPHHADLVRSWAPGGRLHSAIHDPKVKAILIVSAHYESGDGVVEVMTDERPGLLFDYSGFPSETYGYTLPNPGAPELAGRVIELLQRAGIPARGRSGRGHDHGVFVPMLGLGLGASRPDLPLVSMSIRGPADYRFGLTEDHMDMGQALAPLREEGILLIGSGDTIHGRCKPTQAAAFDAHLQGLAAEGSGAMSRWNAHPMARVCHPRPDHLVPLFVCAGAAPEAGVQGVQHQFMGFAASHFVFEG